MSRLWCIALIVLAACGREKKAAPGRPPPPSKPVVAVVSTATDAGVVKPRHRDDDAPLRRPKSILLAEAREEIGWKVADGFLTRDEIIDFVMSVIVDRPSLRREVEAMTDEALEEHRLREKSWQYPTDPDRLERAFTTLEQEGILARARFAGCAACTSSDLLPVRDAASGTGRHFRGWVLFTEQDAEGLSAGRDLPLTFGAFEGPTSAVAAEIVKALTRTGLHPVWRPVDQRIKLTALEWHKRRFTRPTW